MDDRPQHPSLIPDVLAVWPPSEPGLMRFSLDGVPERERAAVFREFFGQSVVRYDIEPLRDVGFDVDVKLQALPGLMMMWGKVHGSRNQRTRETLAADPTDDIGMILNLSGPQTIAHHGQQELDLGDGEATLVPLDEVCSFTHRPPGDVLALRVPRKQFAPLLPEVDDCYFRRIPQGTPALKLLTDYIRLIQDTCGVASPEMQHLVIRHVYDLMAVAAGATRDAAPGGLRAARLRAIRRDIAENLDRSDLSVGMLAVRHGCTPRFIQRLFETDGTTFTEYLVKQRLARAHRMLTDPRRSGEKISAIALDAGFSDLSYFNRAFRRMFDDTPSGVRLQALPQA